MRATPVTQLGKVRASLKDRRPHQPTGSAVRSRTSTTPAISARKHGDLGIPRRTITDEPEPDSFSGSSDFEGVVT
ncbi:hypothetical protein GCM10017687_25010 [Streptomyces echinatus]